MSRRDDYHVFTQTFVFHDFSSLCYDTCGVPGSNCPIIVVSHWGVMELWNQMATNSSWSYNEIKPLLLEVTRAFESFVIVNSINLR